MHWDFLQVDGWDLMEVSFNYCPHSPSHMQGFHIRAGIASEHVRHFDRTKRPGVKVVPAGIGPSRSRIQAENAETGQFGKHTNLGLILD
jgi:hypothetical protein